MVEYVLTVHAKGTSSDGSPITLRAVGGGQTIATHATGFDTAPLRFDDEDVSPEFCLTKDGLLKAGLGRSIGEELWRRAVPGDIKTSIAPLIFNSRVYLDLRSTDLARYPWELLYDSGLSLFAETQLCLGNPDAVAAPAAGQPPAMDHPLRILVVLGNDPSEDKIGATEELVVIEAAAHTKNDEVLLRALAQPGPPEIEKVLLDFRPHVLHFIGHGVLPGNNAEPEIHVYSTETQSNDPWRADRIRSVFRQSPPRLVVLNACLTAAPTASSSLAQAFLDAGSIAVVAMMGEIRGDASHALSETFYRELFGGKSVDVSLATARRTVKNLAVGQGENPDVDALRSNWPLPRLVTRGDIATVVSMPQPPENPGRRRRKEDFVARWDERWRVWQALNGQQSTRLTVISGEQDIGKSELLNAIADIGDRHGERVIMVQLPKKDTGNAWRAVLQEIVRAAKDEKLDVTQLTAIAKESGSSKTVIRRFQEELARCVAPARLVVFLDGLGAWEENLVCTIVLPDLCGPYLFGTAPSHTRMVVTLRADWTSKAWDIPPSDWQPIPVVPFPNAEWDRAMTHFRKYWRAKILDQVKRKEFEFIAEAFRTSGSRTGATLQLVRGTAASKAIGP